MYIKDFITVSDLKGTSEVDITLHSAVKSSLLNLVRRCTFQCF